MSLLTIYEARETWSEAKPLTAKELRRNVGVAILALPIAISLGYLLLGGHRSFVLDSLSESYYTVMRDVFVGVLGAVGFFFIGYHGYDKWEDWLFNLCGLLAFLIALFPMNPHVGTDTGGLGPRALCAPGGACACAAQPLPERTTCAAGIAPACDAEILAPQSESGQPFELFFNNRRLIGHFNLFEWIHLLSAALLLTSLGFVSRVFFTRTSVRGRETPQKLKRNRIYRFCGVAIWVALGVYAVFESSQKILPPAVVNALSGWILLAVEWFCLWMFGTSWFVKGDAVPWLRDARPAHGEDTHAAA